MTHGGYHYSDNEQAATTLESGESDDKRWVEPTFWTYGCGSEVTTSTFLAVTVPKCEGVDVLLCCVAFPAQRFTELVTMVA